MPLGFQRLNERTQRPNANINFIKPDHHCSEQDQKIATQFLSRIAAQCYPVMKEHYISVMTLEEYPPNTEFLGCNFNAGECIQLVLKDKRGKWLSFKFVQMVMMHELAHCKQMNHSRFFWNVRNEYAKLMEGLWAKKYTGEGMWGRGLALESGTFVNDRMPDDVQIPEHLCGGTYRRARGRKRKRGKNDDCEKPKLSYAERQQKRIRRKFRKHGEGTALGDDELVRGALERASGGKRSTGKPRVANSKRGRELRANAALARFDALKQQQAPPPEKTPELEDDGGSETDSGWSSDEDIDSSESIILRRKAGQIKDHNGKDMVKVCADEGEHEEDAQGEMDELRVLSGRPKDFPKERTALDAGKAGSEASNDPWPDGAKTGSETESEADAQAASTEAPRAEEPEPPPAHSLQPESATQRPAAEDSLRTPVPTATPGVTVCAICSLENEPDSPTCVACSHVLKPSLMKNHWRCKSDACAGSKYLNAGDVGRCGLCGASRASCTETDSGGGGAAMKPVGLISNDVLRWD